MVCVNIIRLAFTGLLQFKDFYQVPIHGNTKKLHTYYAPEWKFVDTKIKKMESDGFKRYIAADNFIHTLCLNAEIQHDVFAKRIIRGLGLEKRLKPKILSIHRPDARKTCLENIQKNKSSLMTVKEYIDRGVCGQREIADLVNIRKIQLHGHENCLSKKQIENVFSIQSDVIFQMKNVLDSLKGIELWNIRGKATVLVFSNGYLYVILRNESKDVKNHFECNFNAKRPSMSETRGNSITNAVKDGMMRLISLDGGELIC